MDHGIEEIETDDHISETSHSEKIIVSKTMKKWTQKQALKAKQLVKTNIARVLINKIVYESSASSIKNGRTVITTRKSDSPRKSNEKSSK